MKNRLKLKLIKKGMTSIFTDNGKVESCTLLQMPKTIVLDKKQDRQIVFIEHKTTVKKPQRGQLNKYKIDNKLNGSIFESFNLENDTVTVDVFKNFPYVCVQGTSKGKGFAGVMKRHNFSGGRASHGNSLAHRTPGSTGSNQDPGKVMKGKKMPGHMGNETITKHNLRILEINEKQNILVVKGSVPGNINSLVNVYEGRKK